MFTFWFARDTGTTADAQHTQTPSPRIQTETTRRITLSCDTGTAFLIRPRQHEGGAAGEGRDAPNLVTHLTPQKAKTKTEFSLLPMGLLLARKDGGL